MPVPQKFGAELKIESVPQQFGKDVPIDAIPNGDPPRAEISSGAPRNAEEWFGAAEKDIRQGGKRTGLGRFLGKMQGSNEGYSGLESGVSKGVADFMGSPELGALQVSHGVSQIPSHPVKGAGNIIGGTLKAATIPGMVMAGPEMKAVGAMIPTTEHAGQILNGVEQVAKDVPVVVNDTSKALNEYLKHVDAGGSKPSVITKIEDRLNLKDEPLTYEEARRFYSNISRLSNEEMSSLNPNMRRLMGGIKTALGKDIANAADVVSQKVNYLKGMKEYAKAAKLESALAEMRKWAVRAAGTAALGAAGYEGVKLAGGVGGALTPK